MEAHEKVRELKVDLMDLDLCNGVTFGKALDAMCTLSAIGLLPDAPAPAASERQTAIETIAELAENAMKDRISFHLDPKV